MATPELRDLERFKIMQAFRMKYKKELTEFETDNLCPSNPADLLVSPVKPEKEKRRKRDQTKEELLTRTPQFLQVLSDNIKVIREIKDLNRGPATIPVDVVIDGRKKVVQVLYQYTPQPSLNNIPITFEYKPEDIQGISVSKVNGCRNCKGCMIGVCDTPPVSV